MKEPTHNIKLYSGNNIPCPDSTWYEIAPHWYQNSARGWLGSGITDRNGKEIFEGDIVKEIFPSDCANYDGRQLVIFRRGEFLLVRECYWARLETCGATPLSWAGSNGIEIIGRIVEEGNQ